MPIQFDNLRTECPYCKMEQKVHAERYPIWSTAFCDEEIGGCGKLFVYKTVGEPRIVTRKVEGEE